MISPPPVALELLAPELIVLSAALVLLLADLWMPPSRRGWLVAAGIAGAVWAGWAAAVTPDGAGFAGMYVRDGLTRTAQAIAAAVGAFGLAVAPDYLRRAGLERGEYYVLVLVATAGAMLMAASRDLLLLFLALETLSIPLYVLAAWHRSLPRSQEAGMKYFLLGAFASAFLLFGVALLYGVGQTTRLPELAAALAQRPLDPAAAAGMGLVAIGLGFKAAAVPFHTWAPDAYEGAPLPAAAFMSVIAKVGAFAALLRVFPLTLAPLADQWRPLAGALAIVTMAVANLAALAQTNYKRLLAYSSISHTGYLLIGVATGTAAATAAVVGYLAVYAAMTLGAFAVAAGLERAGREADRIDDYAGLAARAPLLAFATAVCMVSLAGLPPSGGFVAKLGVFAAAIEGGGRLGLGLALVGVLTSVISVYYYLRVAYVMYAGEPPAAVRLHRSPLVTAVLALAVLTIVQVGVLPGALVGFAQQVSALGAGR
ncbi:MAG: NADH-quinone oxidoreductase subunit N [Armatimonadota bacterium]|nr:NADH-quinone oxidoreductase subunit N [Armatimonadota bacterium]MDR7533191.1 NADH-quinone oxidoreductase subunit N [Armatimonadota bacterium]MDR7535421.1 NADH-quinone oxidoreductase subunit N [Armatimonadota bacterium]